jgi:hypothetical protein
VSPNRTAFVASSTAWALQPLAFEFRKTASLEAIGKASPNISSHFPANSSSMASASPVMFPPGRPRLATSPTPTGSVTPQNTTGIVLVARLAATAPGVEACTITSTRSRIISLSKGREPLTAAVGPAILDGNIPALHVAQLTEPLAEGVEEMAIGGQRAVLDESDARDRLGLLRFGPERRGEDAGQRCQQEAAAAHRRSTIVRLVQDRTRYRTRGRMPRAVVEV